MLFTSKWEKRVNYILVRSTLTCIIFIRHGINAGARRYTRVRRYTQVGLWANTWPRNVPLPVHVDPGASPDIGRWRASCLQPSFVRRRRKSFRSSQSSPSLLRLCVCEIASPIFASRRATRGESHRFENTKPRIEIIYVLLARVKIRSTFYKFERHINHHGAYNFSWLRLRSRFRPWGKNDNR